MVTGFWIAFHSGLSPARSSYCSAFRRPFSPRWSSGACFLIWLGCRPSDFLAPIFLRRVLNREGTMTQPSSSRSSWSMSLSWPLRSGCAGQRLRRWLKRKVINPTIEPKLDGCGSGLADGHHAGKKTGVRSSTTTLLMVRRSSKLPNERSTSVKV